jgi:hypothetical protein
VNGARSIERAKESVRVDLASTTGQNLMRIPAVGEMFWVAGKPLARPA